MDTLNLIVCILVVAIFAERWYLLHKLTELQNQMNRALIAKSVPEYEYTNKAELQKLKVENDLATKAQNLIDAEERKLGEHYPAT